MASGSTLKRASDYRWRRALPPSPTVSERAVEPSPERSRRRRWLPRARRGRWKSCISMNPSLWPAAAYVPGALRNHDVQRLLGSQGRVVVGCEHYLDGVSAGRELSLIHISEPTRL